MKLFLTYISFEDLYRSLTFTNVGIRAHKGNDIKLLCLPQGSLCSKEDFLKLNCYFMGSPLLI